MVYLFIWIFISPLGNLKNSIAHPVLDMRSILDFTGRFGFLDLFCGLGLLFCFLHFSFGNLYLYKTVSITEINMNL